MQHTVRRTRMAKQKQQKPVQQEQIATTNPQRKLALEEQKKQLEASYQKVLGALELLDAILLQEEMDAKKGS